MNRQNIDMKCSSIAVIFCILLAVVIVFIVNPANEPVFLSAVIRDEGFMVTVEEAKTLARAAGSEILLPTCVPEGVTLKAVLAGMYTTSSGNWHADQIKLVFFDHNLNFSDSGRFWIPILDRNVSRVVIEGSEVFGNAEQLELSIDLPPDELWSKFQPDVARTKVIEKIDHYIGNLEKDLAGSGLMSIWRQEIAGSPSWVRLQNKGYVRRGNSTMGFDYTGLYIMVDSPTAYYSILSVLPTNETLALANSLSDNFQISFTLPTSAG